MEKSKFLLNSIFYLALTLFFIYIFIKEKELVKKINVYKEKFSEFLINKFSIKNEKFKKIIKGLIHWTETLGTALILVLIIQKFYLGNFMVPTGSMIPTIVPNDRLFGNMVIYKFSKPKREDIIVFKEPIQNKVLYTKRLMALPGEEVEIENEKLVINGKNIETRRYMDLGDIRGQKWIVPKKGDTLTIIPLGNYDEIFKEKNIDIAKVQKYLLENPGAVSDILPNIEFKINGKETGKILDYLEDKDIVNKLMAGKNVDVTIDEDYYMALGDNTEGSYDSRMWGFVRESRIKGKALFRFWPLNRMAILK